jgi:RNA polymerase sigma factor for flagellar operon FliA
MNPSEQIVTDALWQEYRGHGNEEARRQIIDRYLGLVYHAAHQIAERSGHHMERDDLVGAGTLGLVMAVEGFDPSRGLAFSTYAVPRIRGAILDDLRAQDWAPRSVRSMARRVTETEARLESKLGRAPASHEIAAALGIDGPTYRRWQADVAATKLVPLDLGASDEVYATDPLARPTQDGDVDAAEALSQRERSAALREAIAHLPAKERLVLALSYFEELTLRQIADLLHVTESRISQIRTQALKRLRRSLSPDLREG